MNPQDQLPDNLTPEDSRCPDCGMEMEFTFGGLRCMNCDAEREG